MARSRQPDRSNPLQLDYDESIRRSIRDTSTLDVRRYRQADMVDAWNAFIKNPFEKPSDISSNSFSSSRWLDKLRRLLHQFPRKTTAQDTLERWFRELPDVLPVWRKVNDLNHVPLVKPRDCNEAQHQDCLLGTLYPQLSHLLPYSEERIVGTMIWMREIGIIPSDPVEAERQKMSAANIIPTIPWMGSLLEFHIGGLLLAPTKKCLWRLNLLALCNLYKAAINQTTETDTNKHPWRSSKVTDLVKSWELEFLHLFCKLPDGRDSEEPDIEVSQHFLKLFNKDYEESELAVEVEYTESKAIDSLKSNSVLKRAKVNVFECHYMLIKNRDGERVEGVSDWRKAKTDTFVWESLEQDGKKVLPQKASKIITTYTSSKSHKIEYEDYPVGGPKLFVPLDPIPLVFTFWKSVQRLLIEDKYILDEDNTEFKDMVHLADFFLRICQCTSPDQVFDIKFPACFNETFPSRPKKVPVCNLVRNLHRDHLQKQKDASNILLKRWEDYFVNDKGKEDWKIYKKRVEIDAFKKAPKKHESAASETINPQAEDVENGHTEAGAPFDDWEEEDVSSLLSLEKASILEDQKSQDGTKIPIDEVMSSRWHRRESKHSDLAAILDELDCHIFVLCRQKQLRFDQWVEEFGFSQALDKQRKELTAPEDALIVKLWAIIKAIKSEKFDCSGRCIEDTLYKIDYRVSHDPQMLEKIGTCWLKIIVSEEAQGESSGIRTDTQTKEEQPKVNADDKEPFQSIAASDDLQSSGAIELTWHEVERRELHDNIVKSARFKLWNVMAFGRPSLKEPKPYFEPSKEEKAAHRKSWGPIKSSGFSEKVRSGISNNLKKDLRELPEKIKVDATRKRQNVEKAKKDEEAIARGRELSNLAKEEEATAFTQFLQGNDILLGITTYLGSSQVFRLDDDYCYHCYRCESSPQELKDASNVVIKTAKNMIELSSKFIPHSNFSDMELQALARDCVTIALFIHLPGTLGDGSAALVTFIRDRLSTISTLDASRLLDHIDSLLQDLARKTALIVHSDSASPSTPDSISQS